MARSIYNQAMKDELEIRPEVKSPWTDFKIQPERISSGGTAITWPALVNEGLLSQLKVAGTDVGGVQAVRFSDSYLYSQITARRPKNPIPPAPSRGIDSGRECGCPFPKD